jgi:hypothetical protein
MLSVPKYDEWSTVLLLDSRVFDSHAVEVFRPRFECGAIRNTQREVVESHGALVELLRCEVRVLHQCDGDAAGMQHGTGHEAGRLYDVDEAEAHHVFPPLFAAVGVRDGQVDVPESVDSWCVHGAEGSHVKCSVVAT